MPMIKATRREALTLGVQAAGLAACTGFGLAAIVQSAKASGWAPEPPGAVDRFADLCVKCGLCVKACPYDTLKLARLGDPAPLGTPFFIPRTMACYMCKDIPCVKACPSGALDKENFKDIAKAQMGVAAVDPDSCLSWQGLRCEVCFRVCPVKGDAITISPHPRKLSAHAVFVPTIHPAKCTGCGMCTMRCPTERPAINILKRESFLGHIGNHYRLGWEKTQHQERKIEMHDVPQAGDKAGGVDYLNDMEDPTL